MSFFVVKFISSYLWLFVTLRFGWAQDVSNNSQMEIVDVPSLGTPSTTTMATSTVFTIKPEYIRFRRASSNAVTSSCLTPPQPVNGEYKLDRYFCDDIADCKVAEGTALEPGSQLIYRCHSGYKAKGHTDVYCRTRGKWSAIPECVEVKCDSLNSISTMVSCTLFGKWMNCDSPVPAGTRAEVMCRRGYKKDTDFLSTRRGVVNCKPNGKWDPQPIRCVPVCGVAITHQQTFVHGGRPAQIGDFPWHASLFVQINSPSGTKKIFQCGATIIQTNLLLTAAHCVYNERTRTTEDPKKFFVITGNVFRDYDSPAHNADIVRTAAVKNVYTYCNYYGLNGNYASDIALLELQQPFEFSSILLPACLDNSDYNEQFLEPGIFGRVAGFGRTATGATSGILQTITVPYVSYSKCKASNTGAQNEAFISSDKFCAGYNNGSAVCDGDSGGGLVFKKGDLWYVMGIVSVGLGVDLDNGEKTCDKYSYSLHTRVSAYMTWIQDVLLYMERNEPYPPCNHESSTSMATVTPTIASPLTCLAPPQPANGERKIHRNFCGSNMNCDVSEGTVLVMGTKLIYSCVPEFSVTGPTEVLCNTNGQWTSIPTCIENPGDPCSLTNGDPGVCISLKNCSSVLEELKNGKLPDKVCGYSGLDPIVCCPPAFVYPTTLPLDVSTKPVGDGRGAIAKRKCMEYSQYVSASQCPVYPVNTKHPAISSSEGTGKIKAKGMEFPHMVAVGFRSDSGQISWACGGTLISEIYVLSSATCSISRVLGPAILVRVGDLNLVQSDDGAMPEERHIVERIIFPEFKPPSQYHNIALFRLNSAVKFNNWIRPACLHTASSVGTQEAIATGWGYLDWADNEGSNDLMKVTLPLVDQQTCSKYWNVSKTNRRISNGIVKEWLICAGAKGKDTCQGDSGGPLFIQRAGSGKESCMYDVAGITSFGKLCGSGTPGVYTRVYNYVPWIESVVWGQESPKTK